MAPRQNNWSNPGAPRCLTVAAHQEGLVAGVLLLKIFKLSKVLRNNNANVLEMRKSYELPSEFTRVHFCFLTAIMRNRRKS